VIDDDRMAQKSLAMAQLTQREKGEREGCYATYNSIIEEIMGMDLAFSFFKPINPETDGAPDYFKIITHPMSLYTVQTKIDRQEYNSPSEFISDMRRIWSNARIYNAPTHILYKTAEVLSQRFEVLASALPHYFTQSERRSALHRFVERRFAFYQGARPRRK
jgi:hypothetical protein